MGRTLPAIAVLLGACASTPSGWAEPWETGGPALRHGESAPIVVGVLSSHTLGQPRRSFYAATAAPENAGWIRRAMRTLASPGR